MTERLDKDGTSLTPLDTAELRTLAAKMRADGVEALAIVFLHSFRNTGAREPRGRNPGAGASGRQHQHIECGRA